MSLPLNQSPTSRCAYDYSFPALTGGTLDLSDYNAKVLLIVNTASACGFTPQYEGLQALYERYCDRGLVVIGVPSNDFGRQEKGTSREIQTFCDTRFHISFPMTDKITVKGKQAHEFYQWATSMVGFAGRPRWNFHKYLIDRSGQISDWFSARTAPDSPKMTKAIDLIL